MSAEDETISTISSNNKIWTHLKFAQSIISPIGIICMLASLATLLGYMANIEFLYRPVHDGPATNPLTALMILATGFVLTRSRRNDTIKNIKLIIIFFVLAATLVRLMDAALQTDIHFLFTPFQSIVEAEWAQGKSNDIGTNTALMLFLTSLSLALSILNHYTYSQAAAFVALAMPSASLVGHAYGFSDFHGEMSLYTTTFGLMLSVGALALTAHKWILHSILTPYLGGTFARYQIVAGYLIPIAAGFLIVKTLFQVGEGDWFGAFIIAVSWFIFMMIGLSTYYQEIIDKERRKNEQLLLSAALHDPLTGLSNRRMFFDRAKQEIERAKRNSGDLWILMLDIDDFKQINDRAGHAVGDAVLIAVSHTLSSSTRSIDLASRIGGEEFAILLVDTSRKGVDRVAESIRSNIEQLNISNWTDIHGPITVSIGGCSANQIDNIEDGLRKADDAMYQSKSKGKNQVTLVD